MTRPVGSLCVFATNVSLWEKIELPCDIIGTLTKGDVAIVTSEPTRDIRRDFYVKLLTRLGVGFVAEAALI